MARVFTSESDLPLTFDENRARATLWAAIKAKTVDFLVVVEQKVIVAAVILVYEHDYYTEACAYVDKFFVHKEFRGLGASECLLRGCLEYAGRRGAKLMFAAATAGMGDRVEKLYVRLFEKHGFSVLGRILMRGLT